MNRILLHLFETPIRKQVVALTILVGTVGILANYSDYLPPNFQADFLREREDYFFGIYQWAFYTHLIAGPITLLLALLLISERLRSRWPRTHRLLGRVQVVTILLLLAPSGMIMSQWAMSGPVASAGFATLAVLTAIAVLQGWRTAVLRQFERHRHWMLRTFALLWSVVLLRLFAGLALVLEFHGTYALAAWLSWLVPLAMVEITIRRSALYQLWSPSL